MASRRAQTGRGPCDAEGKEVVSAEAVGFASPTLGTGAASRMLLKAPASTLSLRAAGREPWG